MKKIAVMDRFFPAAYKPQVDALAAAHGYAVDYFPNRTALRPVVDQYEVLFGYEAGPLLRSAPNLKWYACSYAGVDAFLSDDIWANPDCILTNSSGAYGISISEHLVMFLLMLLRRYPEYQRVMETHNWDRSCTISPIRSVYGLRITVVGTGDLGTNFARRVRAMGAAVRGVRRTAGREADPAFDSVHTADELDNLLPDTDALVLCLPSTPETRHLLNRRRIALLPEGAYVLNVGRGTAIDQNALMEALHTGHLAGAALDVVDPEPLPPDHPLWDTPNLILTPHYSGDQTLMLSRDRIAEIFVDNLARYLTGQPLRNVIDRKRGY